jgi:hypothetical protein
MATRTRRGDSIGHDGAAAVVPLGSDRGGAILPPSRVGEPGFAGGASVRIATIVAVLMVASTGVAADSAVLDLVHLDVCALVPGAEVSDTVGAPLAETRRYNSPDGDIARCVYITAPGAAGAPAGRAFAVELEDPASFSEVRPYVEEPTREVAGLGDGAWIYRDPETGRIRLYVLRREVATIYLTGDDEGQLRSVAELVLSHL